MGKIDGFHLVKLRTPVHGEIEHNGQQVTDSNTWCLPVIYIGYGSLVDSLQQDVESTLELDSKEANIPIGPSDPRFEIIELVYIDYEG